MVIDERWSVFGIQCSVTDHLVYSRALSRPLQHLSSEIIEQHRKIF